MIQWSLWESLLETEPHFKDRVWELMSVNNQISLTKGTVYSTYHSINILQQ